MICKGCEKEINIVPVERDYHGRIVKGNFIRKWCSPKCREKYRNKIGETVIIRKRQRLNALKIVGEGNLVCSNCGCNDIRILEINHINGRKNSEEREQKKYGTFYTRIVRRQRKLDDLNILCKMCNWADFVTKKYGNKFLVRPL